MLKNFFSGYSQNGAAQAIVVLSAFTVAAEVMRTRSTGKRPYRDYGVGGMNEHDPDHDMDQMSQMGGVPHDFHETMVYGADMRPQDMGMDDEDDMDAWAEIQAVHQQSRRRSAAQGARQQMGRQQAVLEQVGRQQAAQQRLIQEQMAQQQVGRQQMVRQLAHMQREDIEGSMARSATPWNRYVATEVPRLMAKGMTAPEAMKAASKSFRRRS
jgi:hypothetical protein